MVYSKEPIVITRHFKRIQRLTKPHFKPGFCSWNRDERKKGNKDECLSRYFGRKHNELCGDQNIKQTLVFAAFFSCNRFQLQNLG